MNTLDKEEFRIKLEEINHLVEKKDYKGAMDVVDSIDWRRVKNVRTLCVVGEIYAANKRYEDSREIFLLAYHRSSIGKNILYRLIEISLKMGDVDDAEEFFEEFSEVAPSDNTKFVLRYKIDKAKNAPLEDQIRDLEQYKEKEFTEKWAYELAKLYYRAGRKEQCLALCNEISLWFSDGNYVMKSLELKSRMEALTPSEQSKFEQSKLRKQEFADTSDDESCSESEEAEEGSEENAGSGVKSSSEGTEEVNEPQIGSIQIRSDKDLRGAETLQERISKGFRDIFGQKEKPAEEENKTEEEETVSELIPPNPVYTEEELKNIPDLEKEGEKPVQTVTPPEMKMPEFHIKDTISKINLKDALKMPELPKQNDLMGSLDMEEAAAASEEPEDEMDFNLEDTILAAASAQGIDIPDDKESPEESDEEEKVSVSATGDEDYVSEEDLQKAESEFLNGPSETEEDELFDEENRKIIHRMMEEDVKESAQEEPELEEMTLSEEEELEQFIESIHQDTNRTEIIARAHELTDMEKQLFTYFIKVPGMKDQILDALCDVQEAAVDPTSNSGNIIVMGGRETGKTRLISALVPAICKELKLEAAKVAYVFADQINGKDMNQIVNRMAGGFLVIEEANQLDPQTAEQLEKAMRGNTDGMIVILEDEKIGMRKFIARYPRLAKKFTSMINIPVFTNDELVHFAKVYTMENGYKIDQMGMLALYNMISENQKADEPMNVGSVKELLDNAISRSGGGLFKRSKKRMDHDGYIILHEKDFS